MRCLEVRMVLHERRLGTLDSARGAALREHLGSCAACAAEERFELRLARSLASLREPTPFDVDVTTRVLSALAGTAPTTAGEVSRRRLRLAILFAAPVAATLLVAAFLLAPSPGEMFVTVQALGSAFLDVVSPALVVFTVLGKLARIVGGFFGAFASLLASVAPAAQVASALCLAAMAITTAVVVGREWMQPAPIGRKES